MKLVSCRLFAQSILALFPLFALQNICAQISDFNENSVTGLSSPLPSQRGMMDLTFNPGSATDGYVNVIAQQSDGKIITGGDFTIADHELRGRIARFNPDGSLDETFGAALSGANRMVSCIAIQGDGKVLIGGEFTLVNGETRNYVTRLKPDGSLDQDFATGLSGANGPVDSIALQSDGRIVIGGLFTEVNGAPRRSIARLNSDGSTDVSFGEGLAGASAPVLSILPQT